MSGYRFRFQELLQPGLEKLILAGACLCVWAVLAALFVFRGYQETWQLWRVPTWSPFFYDLRLIPGMVESLRMNLDPTVENPGDPGRRIFNYPRIWYLFSLTNISQADTLWIGILLIVLFFAGVILFPGRLDKAGVLLMLLVLFSPAAMLLYERANIDLLILFLCAVAVAFSELQVIAAAGLIFIASLFKLFPFFGLGMFLYRGKRSFWLIFLAVLIPFGLYLVFTARNVQASWSLTERGFDISYGANEWVEYIDPLIKPAPMHTLVDPETIEGIRFVLPLISYAAAFLVALFFVWRGLTARERLTSSSRRNLNAFWMGAGVYIGTFLLGNNWDYRLVFLVFAVPALCEWISSSAGRRRGLMAAVMTIILLSCWYLFYNHHVFDRDHPVLFAVDEILNWSLFAGLSYILAVSAPEWARSTFAGAPKFVRRSLV